MRCIEMYPKLLGDAVTATININMRCIEIKLPPKFRKMCIRLTLT